MTFLPIVVRELRVASRRKKTYSVRFWTAFVAALFGAVMVIILSFFPFVPGVGGPIFQGMAWAGAFYCLLLAANTADCVSEEKREGTLGLLFLTDLSGWDVALGKLCANSLKSFYAVLGTFPVVAIVLLLGGVGAGQFCKVALALLNIFFFSHCAGLLASVLSRALDRANAATAALLVGFMVGPPLLALAISSGWFGAIAPALDAFSPGYAFVQAMLPTGSRFYWTSLLLAHLIAWLFLALASWRLPHCWQEKAGPTRLRWRDRFRQWTYGPPAFREDLRRRLAGINPFLWLISRNRLSPIVVWSLLGVLSCCWIGGGMAAGSDCAGVFMLYVGLVHVLAVAGVASEASRHLEEDRRSGALDFVLCSTPFPVHEILSGQWLALRRLFLRPLILVLVSDLVMIVLGVCFHGRRDSADMAEFVCLMAAAMAMLVVDVQAAGWVGMWRAMAVRRPRRNAAAGETVALLLFLPFFFHVVIIMLLAFLLRNTWYQIQETFGFNLGLWFMLAIAVAVGLSLIARQQLLTQFREMAAVQTGEPLGILGQLGRMLGKMAR